MGILKNHRGKKGFQQKEPKAIATKDASVPSVRNTESRRSHSPSSAKVYPVTALLLEYLELPPPRSLTQLAYQRHLPAIPEDWALKYAEEGWAEEATRYDEAIAEQRIRGNWQAAIATQENTLKLTDRLLLDIASADPSDKEYTAGLASLASSLKTIVAVRLQVLDGLQKPDTLSSVEVPTSQKIGQLELF